MQQYLFNSQLFYSVKSHLKFPAKLVFPEFFAHVIATLLNWCFYIANGDEKCETEKEQRAASRKLIICFFDGLQTTINLLYLMGKHVQIISLIVISCTGSRINSESITVWMLQVQFNLISFGKSY